MPEGPPSPLAPAPFAAPFAPDDDRLVGDLLAETSFGAELETRIAELARQYVAGVRQGKGGLGGLEDFMHEYSLSTPEGLALMSLAEALLRVPDAATQDRLIEDKLGAGDWRNAPHGESWLVSATTWALGLSVRLVHPGETPEGIIGRLSQRLGLPAIRIAARRAMGLLGHQFVLGETIDEALGRAREARRKAYRHSFDMLGEGARTEADARRYFDSYAKAIEAIGKWGGERRLPDRPGISIKLSALHPKYDARHAERVLAELTPRLIELARAAKRHDLNLTVDAEEADRLELSLDVFARALADTSLAGWEGFGLAVQAYQKRAPALITWLSEAAAASGRRLMVRLVKGAYWDTEIKRTQERGLADFPVFTRKPATDLSFIACALRLLAASPRLYPQFATHNALTAATIIAVAGDRAFEFQRLHGMGEALYRQVHERDGYCCRIYAPVGTHKELLAYLVRRLLENGANSSFVNAVNDPAVPIDGLIVPPQQLLRGRSARHGRIVRSEHLFGDRKNSRGLEFGSRAELGALRAGLAKVRFPVGDAVPLIAGQVSEGQARSVASPTDGFAVGNVVEAELTTAAAAVTAAVDGFAEWEGTGAGARADALEKAADFLEADRERLMALLAREGGKTLDDGIAEVREAADFCRYYAAEARRLMGRDTVLPGPTGEENRYRLRGRGVFVCISPWNFPLAIFTGQVAAALAAGNTVIAKPAEQTPLIASEAVKLLHRAGIPPEALHFLPGDGGIGAAAVADPRIAGVAFTGSTEVAQRINRALAAKDGPIVPLIAETGGINAMIADATALPEQVADDVVSSAFRSAGQRCSASRLLFVQEDVADTMLAMIIGAAAELRLGDPIDPATDVGPVIDAEAKTALLEHIETMRREQTMLYAGRAPETGTFVAPHVIELDSAGALTREVFGPVLHVVRWRAEELDEVVAAIRATGYGLTFGIHTRVGGRAERIARALQVGNIYVNRNTIGAVVGSQPFGGFGLSGTGPKAGGPNYLQRFALEQVVSINTTAAGGNASLVTLTDLPGILNQVGWQFWIDRGGTFTDIVALDPDGRVTTHKLLSEAPERYRDAAIAGIREILGLNSGAAIPPGLIDAVKMGTTVATNALLERKGEPTLLVVNRGFGDLLRIGNQARPRIFDLKITLPSLLYRQVVEVDARMAADGTELAVLDEARALAALEAARASGLTTCAIALIHAWRYPGHERRLAALARRAGFAQVSASHEVSPLLRLVPRGDTTVVDAYLSPILRRYVDQVAAELRGVRLYFMQSNGGLADAARFQGKDAILSGPAGGIVGAARTGEEAGFANIIGFDMGGTSTDVALYAGGFERAFETAVAGVRLRAPMMAINTVAAGGGSILHFDGARFRVGPDSAGADPGPASYRRGGPLTVTDANVCVGKLQSRHFPAIFGPGADQPLDDAIVRSRFAVLTQEIAAATGERRDPRAVAEGFLAIAVANMANAIKQVSVAKGHDATRFTLQCFGGAGGQHACLVADELGIETVLIHPHAGVLSAVGMGLADQARMREQAVELPLEEASLPRLETEAARLASLAAAELEAQGAAAGAIEVRRLLHLRYAGTDAALVVPFGALPAVRDAFTQAHRTRFGFATPERQVIVEAVAVEAIAAGERIAPASLPSRGQGVPSPIDAVEIWTGGAACPAPVFDRDQLLAGDRIAGPALIREANATTVVEPGWTAEVTAIANLLLRRTTPLPSRVVAGHERADPVLLEMFNNLFMNVAEQAGAVLQNTSLSVNIKERLDFSCAVFDGEGNLVANAPHIPVHLGAMGESVRTVLARRRDSLKPGDVVALNNPFNGGTHLPDVTVITPVFDAAGREILFFLGSRGHHADIGGITPGSTPPASKTLEEEGVIIDDFLLVDGGRFREAEFRALLLGARYPARSPDINIADIKAQVAANEKGVQELGRVVAQYGWPVVRRYMGHVMANAEESVRRVVDRIAGGSFDYRMDDGSPLKVAVRVDRAAREVTVDFTGTGPQRSDNFNTPPAVSRAAVLYCFRCLVGQDIPLNEGCLKPIRIVIPPGTFLSPAPGAAVVAGNTEVSQAVTNAVFGALGVLACSQATMNNFLFGDARQQYYETICGGTGAGPGFDGTSAVHSHMTNTRMTDPEVLELRHPVRVEEFSIRRGSGGRGRWQGGDGAVRRLRFLEPMTAVIVASRRNVAPFGLAGGADGAPGRQWLERADGSRQPLAGTDRAELAPGDLFAIETPGGGGYGVPEP